MKVHVSLAHARVIQKYRELTARQLVLRKLTSQPRIAKVRFCQFRKQGVLASTTAISPSQSPSGTERAPLALQLGATSAGRPDHGTDRCVIGA